MMDCRHPDLLKRSEPLAPSEVDWLLLETTFWSSDISDPPTICSTLLLSCSTTNSVGGQLVASGNDAHQLTCTYGRTNVSSSGNWVRHVGARNAYIEYAILFADGSKTIEVSDLVSALKADGVEQVILVCEDSRTRESVLDGAGFVVGSTATDITTAAMLADIVQNGVMAPAKLRCIDGEDLRVALGTAQEPSVLAEALWRRDPFRFEFMGSADQLAFEKAAAVFVHPVLGNYRFAELGQLSTEVMRSTRRDDAELVFSWPLHGFHFGWNSRRASLVRMLCRPGCQPALTQAMLPAASAAEFVSGQGKLDE